MSSSPHDSEPVDSDRPNGGSAEHGSPTEPRQPVAASSIDGWLQQHTVLLALALTAVGLGLRVVLALPSHLNPDEAWHAWAATQPDLAAVFRENALGPHPPLLHVLVYLWHFIGDSDFMLRLPSVLAGTAALWFLFRWLDGLLGRTAGLVGLAVMAFAPSVVYFSAEIREYSLLVMFVVGTLCSLERAFRERSARWMALAAVMAGLALLVHYSAILFLAVVGVYSLARLLQLRQPGRVWAAWGVALLLVAGLLVVLYLTHISKIRGGAIEGDVKGGFLQSNYFRPGAESLMAFAWTRTAGVFRFLFATRPLGYVGLALFVAGIALLIVRPRRAGAPNPADTRLGPAVAGEVDSIEDPRTETAGERAEAG
ncbi:glycosyltransferase family 39 protein, partial [candidate division WOR-3 bacterium]|nr:glycosyltransferase family 39 protein [candidate division WOR-3 bacterium]